jgi:hypothetical protein
MHDATRSFRRRLAQAVMSRLKSEIPGISAHFGEDYEFTDEPEVQVYRRTGGHFRWLAFAFSPWRMWDLHVGVVATEDRLSLGFHVSERAEAVLRAELERLAKDLGTSVVHQKTAVEYQANLPAVAVEEANLDAICSKIVELCRSLAPVARRVACPPHMCGAATSPNRR